ncbi:MAG: OsmC family protein [Azospirillaceae bacterium]
MTTDIETRGAAAAKPAPAKPAPTPRNGVDTPTLFATIDAVAGQPDLARFVFRSEGRWMEGTHSRSTMSGFFGAGGEHVHKTAYTADADHPAVLCGKDDGPTPVEYVLHALSACLTAGIANIAAARGVDLGTVETTVEGDIDLRGILGLSDEVRNGFEGIRVTFTVTGDADAETLGKIVGQSKARSAVYDIVTNGVPVSIDVRTAA